MKTQPRTLCLAVAASFALSAAASLRAGTFNANFNDGLAPAGTGVSGNAVVESTGGVNDSGTLKITKNANSQQGGFTIEDLDGGAFVYGFKATFMALVGGGTTPPADGWSFNAAPDLPDGGYGELGAGTGITVGFDTYDNVDGNPDNEAGEAPALNLKVGGQVVLSQRVPLSQLVNSAFVPVIIAVNADGSLDVTVNGQALISRYYFANYQPLASPRYGFGARTGGLNEKCFIDDLTLETYLEPLPGIVQHPQDRTVLVGSPAVFQIQVNNGDTASIQWLRDGAVIPGATTDTYTLTPANLADDGARFSARVTLGATTVTSTEATLKVVTLDLPPAPTLSYDFNDGSTPSGTTTFGTAYVNSFGGVNDSGMLVLTDALNDQNGSFLVEDPVAGAPVYGVAAHFRMHAGGGTEPPADGFSFNYATDVPDGVGEAENGGGTGLSVCFDTYDNGGGEAPAVAVKYAGTVIAETKVGPALLRTGSTFADVIIRLTPDGLIDVVWNGTVLFSRLPVPGFSSITGGRFALYARTGGLNDAYWADDLDLYAYLTADVIRVTTQPKPVTVLLGKPASFNVEVNLPAQATYQWYRGGAPLTGETQAVLTLATTALADNGAKFKVEVKAGGTAVTSDEVVLTVVDLEVPANPVLSYSFDDGQVPAGAEISGNAFVDSTGGVNGSGVLKLTLNENSQAGAIRSPLVENGAQVLGFTLAVDVLSGGGTQPPADGFSLNVGSDLPAAAPGEAENGAGTGVTAAFDTYDNGGGEAPSIDIRYRGQLVATTLVPLSLLDNADTFFTVLLRVSTDGKLDLAYGDTVIYAGLPLPDYTPLDGARVAAYSRTGGANANHFMDNLRLGVTIPATVAIIVEPADALVLAGQPATFAVQVSNPTGVTYRWFKNGGAIAGATQPSYTTPALAVSDDGTGYSVEVKGPGNTVMSRTALALVMATFDAGANPVFNFTFDDAAPPAGSVLFGSAYLDFTGGVNGSGALKLTEAVNDQNGSWLLDTPAGVTPINDFTATWKMRVGGGTATPADGFAFVLGDDVADGAFGENGAGSGLVVSFDTYDNGGGEAPAIDVSYKGDVVGTRKLDISVLRTGDGFADLGVRVNRSGTLDLYYGNTAVFRGLALPGYQPFAAGRFGWGARTGGLNDNHWVDNVRVALNLQPNVARIGTIKKNANGTITIEWTGGGVLQTAPSVTGPWSDIPGSSSPYTLTPSAAMGFHRVRQ